jgi:hypothetical protein
MMTWRKKWKFSSHSRRLYIADMMEQMFAITLEGNDNATITTASGSHIKSVEEFPTGQKFADAFKPIQSEDTKSVKMIFHMMTAPSLGKLKRKHTKLLVDHLQSNNMHLDESFSGSNEEELIGYFLGFQASKVHLTGFSDDLGEMMSKLKLLEGEEKMCIEANKKHLRGQSTTHPHSM